jgi:hypothetical protein
MCEISCAVAPAAAPPSTASSASSRQASAKSAANPEPDLERTDVVQEMPVVRLEVPDVVEERDRGDQSPEAEDERERAEGGDDEGGDDVYAGTSGWRRLGGHSGDILAPSAASRTKPSTRLVTLSYKVPLTCCRRFKRLLTISLSSPN